MNVALAPLVHLQCACKSPPFCLAVMSPLQWSLLNLVIRNLQDENEDMFWDYPVQPTPKPPAKAAPSPAPTADTPRECLTNGSDGRAGIGSPLQPFRKTVGAPVGAEPTRPAQPNQLASAQDDPFPNTAKLSPDFEVRCHRYLG